MPAAEEDLDIGTKVVWVYRGKVSYAAEVLQPPGTE